MKVPGGSFWVVGWRSMWRLLFFFLLLAVIYLSWKPSPAIVQVPWMPPVLGQWFDRHDHAKNILGFGILASAGFLGWGKRESHAVQVGKRNNSSCVTDQKLLAMFCSLVAILELGQLALPRRVCDWADILAGWGGVILAWLIFRGLRAANSLIHSRL